MDGDRSRYWCCSTDLSPYLELRTAYAFNMYSNLLAADGKGNHLLVTRTAALLADPNRSRLHHCHRRPGIALCTSGQFDIPFLQLNDNLSRHPTASLT